ncbi:MAG: hypothetical protein ACLQBK_20660 [Candidatus Sulfotelmatobacter sp.]
MFDLLCELLRFTPKLHTLQSSDQQLQMLDFAISREQSLVLSDDQRFQASRVNVSRSGSVAVAMRGVSHELCSLHPCTTKISVKKNLILNRHVWIPRAFWPAPVNAFQ